MKPVAVLLGVLVTSCCPSFASNPSLDISQYAHTAWTVRDGFSLGNIYTMAQTPDGYLWLGGEFGLFRFDGVHFLPWQPPVGQRLPDRNINSLLVTRDGAVWIGTFSGLVSWSGGKLTHRPELGRQFVASLFEDREGTVWAGSLDGELRPSRLCAIRSNGAQCYGEDGAFGRAVWALYEDNSGILWAAAQSGLWRMSPGPPRRYPARTELIGLSQGDDGRLLAAMHGSGFLQLAGDKLESYPIYSASDPSRRLPDREVNSNKLLRDRYGGLWIGTVERGLIHLHRGRTDVFTRSDGLSGDVILCLFEDREGTIWTASTGGLDRFRELPVSTVSVRQGLSSDATQSVLAATDGSIWVGAHDGLTRWKNGQTKIYRKASGLPNDSPQSLFQDDRGRIWMSTRRGLAYFKDGGFVAVSGVPSELVYSITGDKTGSLWLSGNRGLSHMADGRLVEHLAWSALGRQQQAKVVLADQGGVWLSFWVDGGVLYFKDRQVRASYTKDKGLGGGPVTDLQFDRDGALWASTQEGGLSRIKDGRITTLTARNGLPCDTIHWTIEDNDRAFWLYTACGLVRITRTELDAWIADQKRRIETTVWDAADGVRLRSLPAGEFGPSVAKATDGKLWYVTGEGVQVVHPHHLAFNKLPPPVHIELVRADEKPYPVRQGMRLPPNVRDVAVEFTGLSLAAPERVRFKYIMEGQDPDWREVTSDRRAQYSNLHPREYRFRVIACNNSGVWNETGDTLSFSIEPAFYQTNWFRTLCAAILLALLRAAYQLRVRQLRHEFDMASEARLNERMRIARELHDNLLQTVQGFMLRLQAVNEVMPPGAAKNELEETLEIGDRAIVEGRRTVQNLRALFTTSDLAQSIRELGDELTSSDGAAFRLVVEGPARNLQPIVRDEVYSIAREALRNAFAHACATHIDVVITVDERLLRLRIQDDGIGFAPEIAEQGRTGHYGLGGMRERARQIGSKLVISSGVGTGTEIDLSIAGSVAYAKPPGRPRFSLLRNISR